MSNRITGKSVSCRAIGISKDNVSTALEGLLAGSEYTAMQSHPDGVYDIRLYQVIITI